jgi:hypothetical protein
MRRTIHFPAVFPATPPRHTGPKTVVAFVEGEVEIPEIHPVEAPVCIMVEDRDFIYGERAGTEYRVHEGRFLRDTGIAADEFGLDEAHSLDKRASLVKPMLMALRKELGFGDSSVYPTRAMNVVSELLWLGGVAAKETETWRAMAASARLAESDVEAMEAVERWRELAFSTARRFAVIEGTVWKQTAEPCYSMDIGMTRDMTTRPADFFEQLRSGLVVSNDWNVFRAEGRNFGLLETEEAHEYARAMAAERELPFDARNLPRIEAVTTELPLLDFAANEFERIARLLVYDMADAFRSVAHGFGVDFFTKVPAETMSAFIAARDALPGMNADRGITAGEEAAVLELAACMNASLDAGFPYLAKLDRRVVNEIIGEWPNRRVLIDEIAADTAPGAAR